MYCVIKCTVRGNEARVKNADLRHPSRTVVKTQICVTGPQCVKLARQISRRPQRNHWFDPSQVGVRFVVDEVAHKHVVAVKFGNRAR